MKSTVLKTEYVGAGTPDRRDVYLSVLFGLGGLLGIGIFLALLIPFSETLTAQYFLCLGSSICCVSLSNSWLREDYASSRIFRRSLLCSFATF